MKRGKRILKVVWENVWVGSGMVFLLCIAQFFRLSQWSLESVKEIAGSMFAGGLVIVSAATLSWPRQKSPPCSQTPPRCPAWAR